MFANCTLFAHETQKSQRTTAGIFNLALAVLLHNDIKLGFTNNFLKFYIPTILTKIK